MNAAGSPDADGNAAPFRIPVLIGVAGHRDLVPAQVPAIRTAIEQLLLRLRAAQPDVRLQLLSSMAEGADLLAAEVAVDLGIDVIALLPFPLAQCRADIADAAARASFDRVLARAERLELAPADAALADAASAPAATAPAATAPAAMAPAATAPAPVDADLSLRDWQFQRAGALMARSCALLVVVWDGRDTGHAAGTARVVDYRRRKLAAAAGAAEDLLLSAGDNDLCYEIRCARRSGPDAGAGAADVQVPGFVGSDGRSGDDATGLPPRFATLLQRTAEFNRDVDSYATRIARHGRRLAPPTPYATPPSLRYVDQLFTAADWLGVHFRHCFTRALRIRYLLWALLAFLLLAFKKQHAGAIALASIGGVLLLFVLGWMLALWAHRRRWHRRYLDYRALAEGLRVDFYWELAGVRALSAGEFAHESFLQKQDYELEWIRAAMRAVSLRCALSPPVSWPHGFAHTFAAWVGDADPVNGSGQLQYYHARARALERRQRAAERIARALLFAGLGCGALLALDAAAALARQPLIAPALQGLMLWALALLTVYGAIFEIYLGEKADRALIRQYRYMDALFGVAARELRAVHTTHEQLAILRSLGHACLAEHAQWILAHCDKRIEGLRW